MLSPQELLVAVELPAAPTHSTQFFHEFSRRNGDYAIVGLAAQAIVKDGQFADIRPLLARSANRLIDVAITPAVLSEASSQLGEELDPPEDQQATPAMRRHLAKVLLARGVSSLLSRPDLCVGAPA